MATRKETLVAEAEELGLDTEDMTIPQLEAAIEGAQTEDNEAEGKTEPPPAPEPNPNPNVSSATNEAKPAVVKPTSPGMTSQPNATKANPGEKLYMVNWTVRLPAGYNHKGDTVSLNDKTAKSLKGAVTEQP